MELLDYEGLRVYDEKLKEYIKQAFGLKIEEDCPKEVEENFSST